MQMKPLFFLASALAIIGAGCSTGTAATPVGMPEVGLPTEAIDAQIRVWAPEGLNTFKINQPIGLAVEVLGSEQVIFARDFGNRMFQYANEEWREVENVPTDWGEGSFLLSPSNGDPMEWQETEVFPWFGETDSPILLRLFVIGHVYRQGATTDDAVGAYVDVILRK